MSGGRGEEREDGGMMWNRKRWERMRTGGRVGERVGGGGGWRRKSKGEESKLGRWGSLV